VKPHGFHREARAEYVQAAQDYAAVSPELGSRFYDEIERLIAEVCQWPEAYRCIRPPVRSHFSTISASDIASAENTKRITAFRSVSCQSRPARRSLSAKVGLACRP
jgi:hypothetical protein